MLRKLVATRYVTPLREGGSLPAIVEADDDGLYVLKFRGAGQGPKSLIAELVAGEIARLLHLPMPELVFMEFGAALGQNEPDYEIQKLLKASEGLNLAMDYLPGSLAFDPLRPVGVDPLLASSIVWFDSYVTNVDRTPRNTNMLVWHRKLWLVDNAAALYFHHNWDNYLDRARTPFAAVKDHVLLPEARLLKEADLELKPRLSVHHLREIVELIPDEWLEKEKLFDDPATHREAYLNYLVNRLEASSIFTEEAINARARLAI